MLAFLRGDGTDRHQYFREGTTIEQVLNVYSFDMKLRLSVLEFIEMIEVGFRGIITEAMCPAYGPHWYLESSHYNNDEKYKFVIRTIKRQINFNQRRDPHKIHLDLWHYFNKYSSPSMPPFWMICESISFGLMSKLYLSLNRRHRIQIANQLDLHEFAVGSWIHTLCFLRNCCAHFVRIWDRDFSITPAMFKDYKAELEPYKKFYVQSVVLQVLSRPFRSGNSWAMRLKKLFDEHPDLDTKRMGFPEDWHDRDVWQDRKAES